MAETAAVIPGQPRSSRLRGYFTIDRQGRYYATLADPTGAANLKLYELIHQAPAPWHLTQTGSATDQAAYRAAMQYVTNQIDFAKYGPDLRAAYYLDNDYNWLAEKDAVSGVKHPSGGTPGFTATQLDALKTQLLAELNLLTQARGLFDDYAQPYKSGQAGETDDLKALATDIQDIVNAPNDTLGLSIVTGALAVVTPFVLPAEAAVIGATTAAVSIGGSVAADNDGNPVSGQVEARVQDLASSIAKSGAVWQFQGGDGPPPAYITDPLTTDRPAAVEADSTKDRYGLGLDLSVFFWRNYNKFDNTKC